MATSTVGTSTTERKVLRKSMNHRLNTPRQDFEDYIVERLEHLKSDLVEKCERIAIQRELNLKMEVERSHKEIDRLRSNHHSFSIGSLLHGTAASTKSCAEKAAPDSKAADDMLDMDAAPVDTAATNGSPSVDIFIDPGMETQIPRERKDHEDGNVSKARPARGQAGQPRRNAGAASLEEAKEAVLSSVASASSSAVGCLPKREENQRDLIEEPLQPPLEIIPADHSKPREDTTGFNLWAEWRESEGSPRSKRGGKAENMEESQLESAWIRGNPNTLDGPTAVARTWTVSPNSSMALSWDFLGIPVLLYDLVTLPLQVFWEHEGSVGTGIGYFITAYWTIDIFLRLLVIGYLEIATNEIQLDRRLIIRRYLRHSFCFDIVLVIPDWVSMVFAMPRNFALLRVFRTMRFLRLTRMQKLRQIARKVQDLLDSESFSVYLNVAWNLLLMLSCCHYIGCFWYWIGTLEPDGYDTWVKFFKLEDSPDWEFRYLTSLHWALCQFTPGSMSMSAVNIPERITSIFVQLWGIVVFSLFVSNLTQERLRLQSFSKKMDRDNWLLRRYMKQHRVSRGLALRAVKYVDSFVAPALTRVQRKDVELLDSLSRPLQLEIQAEIYFHTLLANPFFWRLEETSFTMASNLFADAVAEISLARNDLLFEVGQVSHEMFIVSQGVVGYLLAGTNDVLVICKQQWCCEQVLWVPWIHKGTARAAGESFLLSVDSAKFRTEVLEFRERIFVRSCAQAYLHDLQKCVEQSVEINDILRMHEQLQYGEFVTAYNTDFAKEDMGEAAEAIIKTAEHFL